MASFALKELCHVVNISTATNTNLFTVTAGHAYVIKTVYLYHNESSSGSADTKAFHFEVSDSAGANFARITGSFTSVAVAAEYVVSVSGLGTMTTTMPAVTATGASNSLANMVLEAGQILRLVSSGTYGASDLTKVIISGIDNTL